MSLCSRACHYGRDTKAAPDCRGGLVRAASDRHDSCHMPQQSRKKATFGSTFLYLSHTCAIGTEGPYHSVVRASSLFSQDRKSPFYGVNKFRLLPIQPRASDEYPRFRRTPGRGHRRFGPSWAPSTPAQHGNPATRGPAFTAVASRRRMHTTHDAHLGIQQHFLPLLHLLAWLDQPLWHHVEPGHAAQLRKSRRLSAHRRHPVVSLFNTRRTLERTYMPPRWLLLGSHK